MESPAAAQSVVAGLEPGVVVADKYRIERMLGRGGMGVVYAATHVLTGKQLALKWLLPAAASDPVSAERFLREAQAAGRIHHANVVQVFDVGTYRNSPFMVMEMLHGEPLTTRLARLPTEPAEVVTWLLAVVRGLAAAHKVGVVHRDMKPDNIFLCETEEGPVAKILDFGISKLADEGALSLTQSGVTMGTPFYMSPEQIRGGKNLDHRTDIYSMGVILYEALVGRVPFSGASYAEVILEVAMAEVIPPSQLRGGLPDGLEAIVLRAMDRNPDERFQSMDELAAALRPYARSGSTGGHAVLDSGPRAASYGTMPIATPSSLPTPGSLPVSDASAALPVQRRGKGLAVAAIATILALGLGIGFAAFGRGPGPAPQGASTAPSAAGTTVAAPAPPPPPRAAESPAPAPSTPVTLPAAPPQAAATAATTPALPESPTADTPTSRGRDSMRPESRPASGGASPTITAPTAETTRTSRQRRTGNLSADEF